VIERDPLPVPEDNARTVPRSTGSTEQPPKGSAITKTPIRRRQRKKQPSALKGNVNACPEVEITTESIRPQKNRNQAQERSLLQLELTTATDETRTEQQQSADVRRKSPVKQLPLTERVETSPRPKGGHKKQHKAPELEISGTPNDTGDKAETTRSEILQTPPHSPCIQSAAVKCDDISNTQQNLSSPPKALPVRPVNPHPFLEDIESDGENVSPHPP
jgi:hypothetical protein